MGRVDCHDCAARFRAMHSGRNRSSKASSVPLALESQAEEIAFTPNQAAFSDGAKIIEGQVEAGRQHGQIVRPNSCATIRHIGDVAGADPELALEEKQGAFLDARPAN